MARIITVKLPDFMIEKIDALRIKLGFHSRSEFIREAIVAFIKEVESIGNVTTSGYVIYRRIRRVVIV